jgi:hypothetical protein
VNNLLEPATVPPPLALRPREAAKSLSISPRTLWGLTAPRGPIRCIRLGTGKRKTVLYRVADLNDWLARSATRPAEPVDGVGVHESVEDAANGT